MKRRNGFTLVEILIALALVGVLSAIAINTLTARDTSEEFTAKRDKAIMNIEGVIHETMFENQTDIIISVDDNFLNAINTRLKHGTDGNYNLMRDGTAYIITSTNEENYVANITIDVNGPNIPPNLTDNDIFTYKITQKGNLIPASIAP